MLKTLNLKILLCYSLTCMLSYTFAETNNFLAKTLPLKGKVLKFSDNYGPHSFSSKVIHYKTPDDAQIEATILTPNIKMSKPGLVFIHMWARDRHTFWGLPEFLASHGYPSIYMDLRGHGNSKLPNSDQKITIQDVNINYSHFYQDILPAIDIINNQKNVRKNNLILIGASIGCPLGVNAVYEKKDKFIGMIHLAPAIAYFDANCINQIKNITNIPIYAISDKNDKSFESAKYFMYIANTYKTFLQIKGLGHGSDILYHDLQIPTIILNWINQIEVFHPILINLNNKGLQSSNNN